MGRAQKLKQQRRDEERLKELEKHSKRKKTLLWTIIGTVTACVIALILVVVLVRLPTYVKQMVVETERGSIIVELKQEDAPETCAHLEAMISNGSYRDSNFYFVDETAALTGIEGRISSGPDTPAINARGAVGMAKPSDPQTGTPLPDSATNEFYILKTDTPSLDPDFTIFGHVTEGMDVADALTQGTEINSISLDESGGYMTMEQDSGKIVIELDTEGTPQTVQHVTGLVNSGFYDGMNWYRVEDFVVQTGSHARSLEQAGADAGSIQQGQERDSSVGTVVDEIAYEQSEQDPVMLEEESRIIPDEQKLPPVRGAVGMYKQLSMEDQSANQNLPSTEMFFMKKDLSGEGGFVFTVFGEVIEGMPVVDSIQQGDVIKTVYIREVRKD